MKNSIAILGSGIAGLYSAILIKHLMPNRSITVHEKQTHHNRSGWGVILKDNLLHKMEQDLPDLYNLVKKNSRPWNNIKIDRFSEGMILPNQTGYSICRSTLVDLLTEYALGLDIKIRFNSEKSLEHLSDENFLVIDSSGFRFACRELARSQQHLSDNRFIWLGCDKALTDMVFSFRRYQNRLFWTHIYPFSNDLSTVVLEAHKSTLDKLGIESMPLAKQVRLFEGVFKECLDGASLLTLPEQSQRWRTFNQYRSQKVIRNNIVYLGDRAHTAHFSIGSGTALAIMCASELAKSVAKFPLDAPSALASYEVKSQALVERVQKPALASMQWFDQMYEHISKPQNEFLRAFLTRSIPEVTP